MLRIIAHIPTNAIISESGAEEEQLKAVKDLLVSLHDGVLKEPRVNLATAWACYNASVFLLSAKLPKTGRLPELLRDFIMPMFEQYMFPREELSSWSIGLPPPQVVSILANAFQEMARLGEDQFLEEEWTRYLQLLRELMSTSQPQQSTNYAKSQDLVAAAAKRWFALTAELNKDASEVNRALLRNASLSLVECAIEVLRTRNGKPYGAAVVIEYAMHTASSPLMDDPKTTDTMKNFLSGEVPSLLLSPSSSYLIRTIGAWEGRPGFQGACDVAIESLLQAPEGHEKTTALKAVLTSPGFRVSSHWDELNASVMDTLRGALKGSDASWELISGLLESPLSPPELTEQLLSALTERLSLEVDISQEMHAIDLAVEHNPETIKRFCTTTAGSQLLSKLLFLSESSTDGIAQQAAMVSANIERVVRYGSGQSHLSRTMVDLLNRELKEAGPDSLS